MDTLRGEVVLALRVHVFTSASPEGRGQEGSSSVQDREPSGP